MIASIRLLNALLVSAVLSGAATAQSLCKATETLYFSCQLTHSAKVVSLCGNALAEPDRFWLQYRFGTTNRIELSYPPTTKRVIPLFAEAGFDVGYYRRNAGYDTDVSFKSGGWSYTVFSNQPGEGETKNSYGIFIARKREGPGKTLSCSGPPDFGLHNAFSSFVQTHANDK